MDVFLAAMPSWNDARIRPVPRPRWPSLRAPFAMDSLESGDGLVHRASDDPPVPPLAYPWNLSTRRFLSILTRPDPERHGS